MFKILMIIAVICSTVAGTLRGQSGTGGDFPFPFYSGVRNVSPLSRQAPLPDLGLIPISSSRYPGHLYDLAYHDGLLALANGWQRYDGNVILFDASMPDTINRISSYSLYSGGGAIRVAMTDGIALVSVVDEGLVVLDISVPTDIRFLGSLPIVPSINEVVIVGDRAFLPLMNTGLAVVDISDPASPAIEGIYRSNRPSFSLTVNGDHAYVADGVAGLSVYDISDPADPVLVNTIPDGDDLLLSVAGRENLLGAIYRSSMINTGGIVLYDVSDPSNPVKVGECSIFGVEAFPSVDLEMKGDFLFLTAGQTGFQIYDISDPSSPERMGGFGGGAPPGAQFANWPSRLAVGSRNVYTICPDWFYVPSENDVQVLDVSDPVDPGIASRWDTPAAVRNSVVVANTAYLAASHDGLVIQDIADPENPVFLSRTWSAGESGLITGTALEVRDEIVYVVGGRQSLTTIDAVNPVDPFVLGSYDEGGYASDIALSGDFALITHYEIFPEDGWVSLVDIGDPRHPVRTGRFYTGTLTFGVDCQGSFAFLGCRDGVQVVDISDPYDPVGAGFAVTGVGCYDVVARGDLAFAVDEETGLNVIDITDPFHLQVVATLETPGVSKDLAIEGDRAYIADYDGIVTVDISDPTSPLLLGRKKTWGNATGISAVPEQVFLSDTFGWDIFGIVAID